MIPLIRVKVRRKNVVQGKALVKFPASVGVAAPLLLDRTGGNYNFSLSIDLLRQNLDPYYLAPVYANISVNQATFLGSTSGNTVVKASAVAGATTLTLPAATDTLVGKATTDTLTNKTFDTAGAGNSLLINGVAATANTGTGAVVRATSPTLVTPNLGTPSAITLTSATGLPISTGVAGLGTGIATFLATPSSANLRAALTDEVGTGAAYFVGGALGTPASGTLTNCTGYVNATLTTSLGANVTMNSVNTYFNGPAVAQGSTGTWLATGSITYTNSGADELDVRLWDGTTIIASGSMNCIAGGRITVALSGRISNPTGNIRIDAKSLTSATGTMEFNRSGNSKDCTLTVVQIG